MYQHTEAEAIQRNKPSYFDSRRYALLKLKEGIHQECIWSFSQYKDASLLDLGCGSMPYKSTFLPYLAEYKGADLELNPNCDIIISREGDLPLEIGQFDIVLSTQVLEHVEDPQKYLDEAYRVLRIGGRLIISTHGYWMYHPDPNDYWRWTSAGLQKIIIKSGFEIEKCKGIVGRSAIGLQLLQDGLIFKLPKIIRYPFVFCCQIFISILDKTTKQVTKNSDAGIFIITAIKK